uniref:Ring finger protein 212 n=1 Tax=Canis lupus dingo TaxID=286419 RepID=A0A8C0R8T0_CANLU
MPALEAVTQTSASPPFQTDVDIQALFMGIDGLCKKYSRETSQVSEFQEKHRRRLLAFYREKIAKLEESLQKSVLRMEQLQSMRLSQEPFLGAMKTPVSTPSAKPAGHLLLRLESSASDRVESMQVDGTPSPTRKPEVAAGPARISLISPPQHGRMGSVSHGGPQLPGLMPSLSSGSQALRVCWPQGSRAWKVNEVLPPPSRPSTRGSLATSHTLRGISRHLFFLVE